MSSARSVACAARSLACCSRSAARSATRSLASRSRTHPGMPRHRSRRSGVSLALTLTLEGLPLALTLCCSRAGTRPHWLTSHAPRAARRAPRRTYKEAAVAAPRRRAGKRRVPSCSAGWPGGLVRCDRRRRWRGRGRHGAAAGGLRNALKSATVHPAHGMLPSPLALPIHRGRRRNQQAAGCGPLCGHELFNERFFGPLGKLMAQGSEHVSALSTQMLVDIGKF